MARGINKAILIGNLGADPETRYTQSGSAVTNIRLATSESWKDRQTGENQERTEWHRVVFFNRLAEIAGQYLRKGSKVYIEGSIRTRSWESDGVTRYTTEIVANEMQMLGGRGDGAGPRSERPAARPERSNSAPARDDGNARPAAKPDFADDFADDDIPF